MVWRWQERFMKEGVDGLLRDTTRKPGKPTLSATTVQKVVDLVTGPPPGEITHWIGRMLAKAAGISLWSVQRILEVRIVSERSSCRTIRGSPRSCGDACAKSSPLIRLTCSTRSVAL
jgi:hypothetical protein